MLGRMVSPVARLEEEGILSHTPTYLSEEPYLEYQREDGNLQGNGDVEKEVEGVGDQPIRDSAQTILLHHYQVLLVLVFHYG